MGIGDQDKYDEKEWQLKQQVTTEMKLLPQRRSGPNGEMVSVGKADKTTVKTGEKGNMKTVRPRKGAMYSKLTI